MARQEGAEPVLRCAAVWLRLRYDVGWTGCLEVASDCAVVMWSQTVLWPLGSGSVVRRGVQAPGHS
jgi:hypothetical protein